MNANLVNQANAAAAIEYNLDILGIEQLVITTADRANGDAATDVDDGYILTISDNDDDLETITVSGSREFSYTASATNTSLERINASGLSGDLILVLDGYATASGVVVLGGSGTNTINGSLAADNITGGALADSITGDTGADVMTGNGGNDTFVINQDLDSEVTVTGTVVEGFDTITDFNSGDRILLTAGTVAGAAAAAPVAATSVQISAGGKVTFNADDDTLAEMVTALAADNTNLANAEVAFFELSGSTYIYGAGTATATATDDFLIKLTGVTGYTTLAVDTFAFSLS
jgi:Ca2+-binding RTX toxin-like protein